jgi:hypothetical protein
MPREFIVGRPYYRGASGFVSREFAPWQHDEAQTVVIETWIYQGIFERPFNSASCDVPYHFLVFQPYIGMENVLERPPECGLGIPSQKQAEGSMLTLEELIEELKETLDQMKSDL